MNLKSIITLSVIGVAVLVFFLTWMSYKNQEVAKKSNYDAEYQNAANILDAANKKIAQTASVTQEQMADLQKIIVGNADARAQQGKGSLAAMVTEAVPNLDTTTFKNLQNIIASARDEFKDEQTTLAQITKDYNTLIGQPVGYFFLQTLGSAKPIVYIPITSSRSQEAMRTRRDDDGYSAFPTPAPAPTK